MIVGPRISNNLTKQFATLLIRDFVVAVFLLAAVAKTLVMVANGFTSFSCILVALDLATAAICMIYWGTGRLVLVTIYVVFSSFSFFHLYFSDGKECQCFGEGAWLNEYALPLNLSICLLILVASRLPVWMPSRGGRGYHLVAILIAVGAFLFVERSLNIQSQSACEKWKILAVRQTVLSNPHNLPTGTVVGIGSLDCPDCRKYVQHALWTFAGNDSEVVFICSSLYSLSAFKDQIPENVKFKTTVLEPPIQCQSAQFFVLGESREIVPCINKSTPVL